MSDELSRIGGDVLPSDLPQPVTVKSVFDGVQAVWRFPNGRGASVINHMGSYGTELAVLRFSGEGVGDYELDYSTPLTTDVIGHLNGPEELIDLLRKIRDLPPAQPGEDVGSPEGGDIVEALKSIGRIL